MLCDVVADIADIGHGTGVVGGVTDDVGVPYGDYGVGVAGVVMSGSWCQCIWYV